jgi:hypothetical protein
MTVTEIKSLYNALIKREKAAERYINDKRATEKQLRKWVPEYLKIIEGLSDLVNDFESVSGSSMTGDEILNGFKEGV